MNFDEMELKWDSNKIMDVENVNNDKNEIKNFD